MGGDVRIIPYSAAKTDLFQPWQRGNYFSNGEAQHTLSLCAELSRLAYCRRLGTFTFDSDQVRSVLATIGFSNPLFIESPGAGSRGGTHCFTATRTDPQWGKPTAVVVFRGTDADDPMDIGDDADLRLTDWNGGRVHAGFLRALDQVGVALDTAVSSIDIPILFTGHSLGAALATLAASLYRSSNKVGALYTFGSPRVGDSEFAATLEGIDICRYRDCCDVVTRVPPSEIGYAHVGGELYIDRNGLTSKNPSKEFVAEDQIAAEGDYLVKYAWRTGDVGVRDMADHAPVNYVWAVAAGER